MLFPVHIYNEEEELPQEGNYYVVAGNGVFMHKDTGLVKCFVPVPNISMLPDLDASSWVKLSLPKIPVEHTQKIKTFFAEVVEKYSAESCTILYFNKETQEYKIHVPQQSVTHGSVNYVRKLTEEESPNFEGFLCVGTIHSHCDFDAFHSGTDISDEKDFDGLHVTFGHNNRDDFTISASVVVNGMRSQIDPEDALDGLEHVRQDIYRLNDKPDVDVSLWMENVQNSGGSRWGLRPLAHSYNPFAVEKKLSKGDNVTWNTSNPKTWISKFGKGPYKVEDVWDEFVVLRTNAGLCHFDRRRLKKV